VEYQLRRHLPQGVEVAADIAVPQDRQDVPLLIAFIKIGQVEDGAAQNRGILLSAKAKTGLETLVAGLETRLSQHLPAYMMPSAFVPVNEIPLSSSAKLDRKTLRQWVSNTTMDQLVSITMDATRGTPPATREELFLQGLWADVLRMDRDQISRESHFFRSGGDSILAMQLVATARDQGFQLTVQGIFSNAVLADMALVVHEATDSDSINVPPFTLVDSNMIANVVQQACVQCKVHPETIEDIYPCTPLQDGLMALSLKEPGAYIIHLVYDLPPSVDINRFRWSWKTVAQKNPILRTRFIQTQSSDLMQIVLTDDFQWSVLDLADFNRETHHHTITPMLLGSQTNRYTIISDSSTGRYKFSWIIHHAVCDEHSLSSVIKSVERQYLALDIDRKPPAKFNLFIKDLMQKDKSAVQNFWLRESVDAPIQSFPELPNQGYRPIADSFLQFDVSLPHRHQSSFTIATAIRAAWALLVAHYSGSRDVVFGATVNGRMSQVHGIDNMVGPTIATVPIRVRCTANQSVYGFLQDIWKQYTSMIPYEHIGMQNIRKLSHDAELICNFQSLLVIQTDDMLTTTTDYSQLLSEPQRFSMSLTYALTVECFPTATGVTISAKYDKSVIQTAQMQRILQHFEHLLHQMCLESTNVSLQNLDMISLADMKEIEKWNQVVPLGVRACLHDLFSGAARAQPNSPAISSWDGQLTYAELDRMSTLLARHLVTLGLKPRAVVGVCFEKSLWVVVSMMAILKAGGAFFSIDPSHPVDRMASMIGDVGATILLTGSSCLGKVQPLLEQVILINPENVIGNHVSSSHVVLKEVQPSDLAFILFTSGSTGKPKGIAMTHMAFCSGIHAHSKLLNLNAQSRVLQFSAYTFDVSMGEIFSTLIAGGCVCIPSDDERMNDLAGFMERQRVNWSFQTPTMASILNPSQVPSLKTLVLGGESATRKIFSTWTNQLRLINTYGPAECSILTNCRTVTGEEDCCSDVGSTVGCLIWITDTEDYNKLVPIGAVGEILVEGPAVANGYYNDEAKTNAAFVENPTWKPGNIKRHLRLYRTGDLGRYNSDGSLQVLGRRDTQIKLRGQRIEIGEIEHHLRQCLPKNVNSAAEMITAANGSGAPVLAAFVCISDVPDLLETQQFVPLTEETKEILASIWRDVNVHLSHILPKYMIPSAIIPLKYMPLSASGKVDRRKLRHLASKFTLEQLATTTRTIERLVPETEQERYLCHIWSEILQVESKAISASDNFFGLGGDSVSAMKLVAKARNDGLSLSVNEIFRHSRLSDMAKMIGHCAWGIADIPPFALLGNQPIDALCAEACLQCNITQDEIEDMYPCTALQEGLLALSIREPGTYMARFSYVLPPSLDLHKFHCAWETVAARTPILRTRLIKVSISGFLQVVVRETVKWSSENYRDIGSRLMSNSTSTMSAGEQMVRYAIVTDHISNNQYFVLSLHHALYDGWSMKQIMKNVSEVYAEEAFTPFVPFNQFIGYLSATDHTASSTFWQHELADATAPRFLAPPPALESGPLTDDILSTDIQVARIPGSAITVATLIRAAWALLVRRYTDSTDVIFGVTLSGRAASVPGIEHVMGPTIATVPVRIRLRDDMRVDEYLHQVQAQSSNMIPHEQTGLQNIRQLSPDARAACDFHSLLIIQTPTEAGPEENALGLRQIPMDTRAFYTYALVLECTLGPDDIQVAASFDSRIVDRGQVNRMINQLGNILQQFNKHGLDSQVQDIEMITPAEKDEILQWNQAPLHPSDSCIHHLFEQRARDQPNRQAVDSWDGHLTYSELDRLSTQLAAELQCQGVGPNMFVPVCFEKSLWAIVSMLGVLKAGGAFVPLDPNLPSSRRQTILDDLQASFIICSPLQDRILSRTGVATLVVSPSLFEVKKDIAEFTSYTLPAHAAFAVFTSGSTGVPKGIVVEHTAVCSSAHAHGAAIGLNRDSRVLQFASYTFDVSLGDIFVTLIHGGCVCVPSESDRMDNLAKVIRSMDVNHACLTSTVAVQLQPAEVAGLKTLVVGGEPMAPEVIQLWAKNVRLTNIYGPAECTIWCAGNVGLGQDADPRDIGRGMGVHTWVVDGTDCAKLAPIGLVGELLIEGPTLARGYLNDAAKTDAAFIQDPVWLPKDPHGNPRRLYKTGDLVRYNSDGSLQFIGRKDTQVKLRGQRIELGEVEYQLRRHLPQGVEVAVDIAVPQDRQDMPLLIAFIKIGQVEDGAAPNHGILLSAKAKTGLETLVAGLEARLSQHLPAYMVPSAFVPVNEIPLSSSAKLDRKTLRQWVSNTTMDQLVSITMNATVGAPPATREELLLQGLWADVLRMDRDQINRESHFFRSGGDSILAMQLVATARDQGFQLTVQGIFSNAVLADMALVVHEATDSDTINVPPFTLVHTDSVDNLVNEASFLCTVQPEIIEDIYPCTPLQAGLLALSAKQPSAYTLQSVFSLPSTIDLSRFHLAWKRIFSQSDILRTRFIDTQSNGLVQVVLREDFQWFVGQDLDAYILRDSKSPMLLGQAMCRFAIFTCSHTHEMHFVFTAHHALFDGWSLATIFKSLSKAYSGIHERRTLNFSVFIQYLDKCDQSASELYWSNYLAGSPITTFPQLHSQDYIPLPNKIVEQEISFVRYSDSTITTATILKAAWSLILAQYANTTDVTFGMTINGRSAPLAGITDVLGPTIATVPFRVQIHSGESVLDYLNRIQCQTTDMIPFEQLGLQSIKRLNSGADAACRFQNLLVIQTATESAFTANCLGMQRLDRGRKNDTTYALNIECTLTPISIKISANFDCAIISEEQMRRIVNQFSHVIEQLNWMQGDRTVGEIEMVSPTDMQDILRWNQKTPQRVASCLHDEFRRTAREHPSKLAINSWDGSLTYAKLEDLSLRLAGHLQTLGVGPGVMVPFCMEKSMWAIVVMLAILHSGAACVPLSPTNPINRLKSIIQNVAPKILICSPLHVELCQKFTIDVIVVSESSIMTMPPVTERCLHESQSEDVAFIMFTSGSTGEPKGVVQQHSAICSSVYAQGQALGYNSNSRILQFAAFTFDVSIGDIFGAFMFGGCVCMPSEEQRVNCLPSVMNEMRVNQVCLTPTVARSIKATDVPLLETLTLGGEPMTEEDLMSWTEKVNLINIYGVTECTIWCASTSSSSRVHNHPANFGRGLAALLWIVDASNHNKLMPVGTVGELMLEGPILARGYLNDSEKTAEAFLDNPTWRSCLGSESPCRLYKTGDLVKYDNDGSVIYVGRKDTQVKLRGQRIELGEIEYQIRRLLPESVQVCVVLSACTSNGDSKLAAFLSVGDSSDEVGIATASPATKCFTLIQKLKTQLPQFLPRYMIPATYVPLSHMPLTISGKTDRTRLVQIAQGLSAQQLATFNLVANEKRPPTTKKEKILAGLWAEILRVDTQILQLDDSLFELGGDSISAMRMVAAARNVGLSLSVRDIFKNPQLGNMASVAETSLEHINHRISPFALLDIPDVRYLLDEASKKCDVSQEHIEDIYPCTPLQAHYMAASKESPGWFSTQFVYSLPTSWDLVKFEKVWKRTFAHYMILRTRIVNTDKGFMQVVVREEATIHRGTCLREYLANDKQQNFTCGKSLNRCAIIVDGDSTSNWFVWSAHHTIYDGWSVRLLINEVSRAYYENTKNEQEDNFNQCIKYIGEMDITAADSFWQAQLAGSIPKPFCAVPQGYQPYATATCSYYTDIHHKGSSSTIATIIYAAWFILIARHSQSKDVTLELTLTGRQSPIHGIETLIAPTITMVPFRNRLNPKLPVQTFIQGLQNQLNDITSFEHRGWRNIRGLSEEAKMACDLATPIIVHPYWKDESEDSENLELTSVAAFDYPPNPVMFECSVLARGINVLARYDSKILHEQEVHDLLVEFERTLQHILSVEPEGSLGSFL
jgi:amino acid adenylation domain-containing protein